MDHLSRTIFCRHISGEPLKAIAKDLRRTYADVQFRYNCAVLDLYKKISSRLNLELIYIDKLPGDVLARLATLTLEDLRVVYEANGSEGIEALIYRPHFKDWAASDLAKQLIALAKSPRIYKWAWKIPELRAHLARGSKGRPKLRVKAELA